MTDSVEIKPRYLDVFAPPAEVKHGIFTSVYDNKMITIAVIIVIILLGIAAYFMHRKYTNPAVPPIPPAASAPAAEISQSKLINIAEKSKQKADEMAKVAAPATAPPDRSAEEITHLLDDDPYAATSAPADPEPVICNAILASGRQCKSKARDGGRCARHSER